MISRHRLCRWIVLTVITVWAHGVSAYSSYGLGNISCQDYLDRRGEDQQNNDLENTSYVHAYLSGYLTAGNMMRGLIGEQTEDISINIHKMVQWLDAKCVENRQLKVAAALERFWVEAARAKTVIKHRDQARE